MIRLLTLFVLPLAALAGCGEVVVFGHVVRENPAKTEAAATKPPPDAASPKHAAEAAAPEPAAATDSTHAALQIGAPTAAASTATPHVLRAISVTLSPASPADVSNVDAAALLDAIRTELRSRNLLDEQNPGALGTAEVLIGNATTRSTVNAVIFGKRPMAGTLSGELRVSGASGEELAAAKIVAESRFTIAEDGHDQNPLEALYRRFAELTADRLIDVGATRAAIAQ